MRRIWAIALNTFREATRNRVFYLILVFVIVMIFCSIALAMLSMDEQDRVVKHLGLFAMNMFALALATFVGVSLVHEELEKKTIYTLMSSGVSRSQFLIGKFLGLIFAIFVNVAVMTLLLTGILLLTPGASVSKVFYLAAFMSLFEMMIITGIAILFSALTSPVLAMILTIIMYIIGKSAGSLQFFAYRLGDQGYTSMKWLMLGILHLLPRLEVFNLTNSIVYGDAPDFRFIYILYGLLYTACLLYVANFVFSRKDFR